MTIFTILVIFFVAADRILKILALNKPELKPIKMAGEFLRFNFVSNYNIAFSLPAGGGLLKAVLVFIILTLVFCSVRFIKNKEYTKTGWLFFIILGASSNLIDRFKYGYVVDYFDLKYFTVFNLADIMIVAGVLGLLCLIIKKGN